METQKSRNVSEILFDHHSESVHSNLSFKGLFKKKTKEDSSVYYKRNERILRAMLVLYVTIGLPFLFVACMYAKFYYKWGMICMIVFYSFETTIMSFVFLRAIIVMKRSHKLEWTKRKKTLLL